MMNKRRKTSGYSSSNMGEEVDKMQRGGGGGGVNPIWAGKFCRGGGQTPPPLATMT